MSRTRTKICGITRLEDALLAARLGVDALGFVFYKPSPRYIEPTAAAAIVAALPPFMTSVALFVDAEVDFVKSVIDVVKPDVLQFHGDETNDECYAYDKPWFKAIRVKSEADLAEKMGAYPDTMAFLLDTYSSENKGGTGQTFDWNLIPQVMTKPLILAGGLTPDNVRTAIETASPFAVDVSGGVEADKGIKDAALMKAFIEEVNHAVPRTNDI